MCNKVSSLVFAVKKKHTQMLLSKCLFFFSNVNKTHKGLDSNKSKTYSN